MTNKKKWYDTWWGSLWALAVIDGNPGSGVRTFMEIDEALQDMVLEETETKDTVGQEEGKATRPCPSGAVCAT